MYDTDSISHKQMHALGALNHRVQRPQSWHVFIIGSPESEPLLLMQSFGMPLLFHDFSPFDSRFPLGVGSSRISAASTGFDLASLPVKSIPRR